MVYLTKDDLITHAYERFIDESSKDFEKSIDEAEVQNIALIKSYLSAKYDVKKIFEQPVRHYLLVRILSKLVLYDIIRRNSARKVPVDYVEEYDKAMQMLEKISTGRINLIDLPKPVDESGNIISNSIWGNNSNKNFYI